MFVKQHGHGSQAFFCLHGWSGDHHAFDPLLPFLPQDACLYSADLPGCGESPQPPQWNLAAITQEIARAVESVKAPSLTLVGNCIGALLGMRVALERPDLFRRLVVIDAFSNWPWYFRVFTAPGWGKYAYATTFQNPIGRWITNSALTSKRTGESDLTRGFATVRHDAALQYLHVMAEIQSPAEFSSLSIPVDILYGARSFRAVRESALVWRQTLPSSQTWELPGAGHLPLQEAAGLVSEIVFRGGACEPSLARTSTSTHP